MPAPMAVIFDMDGVLIDSYSAHFESWRVLAAESGTDYSQAEFVAGFGRTSLEVIAEQWSAREPGLSNERIRELADRKEVVFRELISADFPAMEGAVDLLRALHAAGISLAVGSSGPVENVRLVIDKLGANTLFSATITGSDVDRGKPAPEVFLLAAEELGVASNRCLVVEDAPVGVTAALAAGMLCIGLASTGRVAQELHKAQLVVTSLKDLSVASIQQLIESDRPRRSP